MIDDIVTLEDEKKRLQKIKKELKPTGDDFINKYIMGSEEDREAYADRCMEIKKVERLIREVDAKIKLIEDRGQRTQRSRSVRKEYIR